MKVGLIVGSSLVALASLTSSVEAQDAPQELGYSTSASGSLASKMRLYAGPRLGFGGEVEIDPDTPGAGSSDDDLLTSFGAQVGFDYGLHDYFAAGLELRFAGTNSETRDDNDVGRDLFIDFDVKPRARYPFSGVPAEVYFTLPFGLTLINTNDDAEEDAQKVTGATDVEVSQGPGFNLGIGAGGTYFFTDKLGANLELIYLLYWWGSETKASAFGASAKSEADMSAGQFTMMLNLVYALD